MAVEALLAAFFTVQFFSSGSASAVYYGIFGALVALVAGATTFMAFNLWKASNESNRDRQRKLANHEKHG